MGRPDTANMKFSFVLSGKKKSKVTDHVINDLAVYLQGIHGRNSMKDC